MAVGAGLDTVISEVGVQTERGLEYGSFWMIRIIISGEGGWILKACLGLLVGSGPGSSPACGV